MLRLSLAYHHCTYQATHSRVTGMVPNCDVSGSLPAPYRNGDIALQLADRHGCPRIPGKTHAAYGHVVRLMQCLTFKYVLGREQGISHTYDTLSAYNAAAIS